MKRIMAVVCVALIGATVFAGSSGVSNPVRKDHQPGFGDSSLQAKVVAFNDDVVAKFDAIMSSATALDLSDLDNLEVGSATNGQKVVMSKTYSAAPLVLFRQYHATSNSYATSVTTTNFTAVVPGPAGSITNKYVVIGQ